MPEPGGAAKDGERNVAATRWWGSFSLSAGESRLWRIGPLKLWIGRTDREWRLAHERGPDPFESTLEVATTSAGVDPTGDADRVRFGFQKTSDACRVMPALPDRPFVVTPESRFCLPSGEEITLFISVPLWVGIHVGSPSVQLCETPVFRPSDTWFGPPTVPGGSCYASRTRARVNLENLELMPHRAVLQVRIRNRAESELALERIRLPLPNLSLFTTRDGRLWTEMVTLERKEDGQSATVELGRGPSKELGPAELVAPPRERMEKGLLMRTFESLL